MKTVRPGFADFVGHRAAPAPVLGTVSIGQNRNLLHRLQIDGLKGLAADRVIVIILSVDQKVIGPWPRSIDGKIYAIAESELVCVVLNARLRKD